MSEPYTVKVLSPLRKIIAGHMTLAKQTIPHFRLLADFEMGPLLQLRDQANGARPDAKISVNDCLIKACAIALMQHPDLNAQLVGEEIHQYRDADISVVMGVEGGLSTPVLRGANRKSIGAIAAEMRALAARAAAGQLKMNEILGGSFALSNLGSYGVLQFDAIINAPQCAILAVGCAKPRVIAAADGGMRVATMLRATLSLDHRVIDGATGAAFVTSLQRIVEQPQKLFED